MLNEKNSEIKIASLSLDIGGAGKRGGSAIFFNDYQTNFTKLLVSTDYKEHIDFFRNWIERTKPDLVIYERRKEGVEQIQQRKDYYMWNLWKIFRTVIGWCQEWKIPGIPIDPLELIEYIIEKNYCWRLPTTEDKLFCDHHKKKAPCVNWYENKVVTLKDELDAVCLWEIWSYKKWIGDKDWLEKRKQLHWQPLSWKYKENKKIDYSKEQRHNSNYTNKTSIQGKDLEIICSDCQAKFTRHWKLLNKPNLCIGCWRKKKIATESLQIKK